MKYDEVVKVGVVRVEVIGFVEGVVVVYDGVDFYGRLDLVFDDGIEGVGGSLRG